MIEILSLMTFLPSLGTPMAWSRKVLSIFFILLVNQFHGIEAAAEVGFVELNHFFDNHFAIHLLFSPFQ